MASGARTQFRYTVTAFVNSTAPSDRYFSIGVDYIILITISVYDTDPRDFVRDKVREQQLSYLVVVIVEAVRVKIQSRYSSVGT